jgi:hypothetical protein
MGEKGRGGEGGEHPAQKLPHARYTLRHAAICFDELMVLGRLGDQMPYEKKS